MPERRGQGFCTFNDVAVASHLLLADGEVERILVIDLDVHQGDGTAEICAGESRPSAPCRCTWRKELPGAQADFDIDVALPDGVRDEAYLETLDWLLPRSIDNFRRTWCSTMPASIRMRHDRLGRLSLTDDGLKDRDRRVFSFFRTRASRSPR
jgi:acetoin utilization deacetylase AcuC-like enzyme